MSEPELQLTKIDCSGCGAGIDVAAGVGRGQVTCGHCGSVIDLSTSEHAVLTKLVSGGYEPRSQIRVGLSASFGSKPYRVMGRLRYESDDAAWDEWFLVAADGAILYLEEDDGDFRVLTPFTPQGPPERSRLDDPRAPTVPIDGQSYRVAERGRARIAYFEGQIAWRVTAGTEVAFLDARAAGRRISVEWTKRELEFYEGREVTRSELERAFGQPGIARSSSSGEGDKRAEGHGSYGAGTLSPDLVKLIVVGVVLLLFVALYAGDGCPGGGVFFVGGGGHGGGSWSSGGSSWGGGGGGGFGGK
jgi:hypothetical protein